VSFGFCSTNQAPLAELAATADETLFENIRQFTINSMSINSTVAGQNAANLQPFAQENMTVHLL